MSMTKYRGNELLFCENCGSRMEMQNKFCGSCGAANESLPSQDAFNPTAYRSNTPPQEAKRKSKKAGVIILVASLLAILIIAGVAIWYLAPFSLSEPDSIISSSEPSPEGTPSEPDSVVTPSEPDYIVATKHTVTFYINDGTGDVFYELTVEDGDVATLPRNMPEREGYSFLYWTSDRGGNYQYDFSLSLRDNLSLFAQWEEIVAETEMPDYIIIRGIQYSTSLTELDFGWETDIILRDEDIEPLRYMVNLRSLDLSSNEISDLSPLSGLTNLETLSLWNNEISDLSPLSGLVNLEWLALDSNQISDLSPLSSLTNLETLGLSDNEISDLSPLSGLINLESLSVWDNQITDWTPVEHVPEVHR